MQLEPENQRHLTVAEGYLELGMFLDADAELERIEVNVRYLPEVLAIRVRVYCALARWDLMQAVAKALARLNPDDFQATVSWAFATRRAESLEAAYAILLEAVERYPDATILHYNLACYECQLGLVEVARSRLRNAINLNKGSRVLAGQGRSEAALGSLD